ncbi:MAG TPA: biopolymer transporter ExbD [Planctomycetota bacterium]|nr:biopolymer transporter ExbD [Planctomycetota bacterium]
MAGSRPISIQEEITPNLIPMIDIMFLLLLFLMIASDMGQRELEAVRLPVADAVIPDVPEVDPPGAGERLIINIYHLLPDQRTCRAYEDGGICREEPHWRIGIRGTDYLDMGKFQEVLDREADLGRNGTDPTSPRVSERKVMIRADAAAPYAMPQKVMNFCARVGMYMIDVGAAQLPAHR